MELSILHSHAIELYNVRKSKDNIVLWFHPYFLDDIRSGISDIVNLERYRYLNRIFTIIQSWRS